MAPEAPLEGCRSCPDPTLRSSATTSSLRRGGAKPRSLRSAKDFGISESCLRNWLRRADIDDGHRPGQKGAESVELRELKRRNRLPEQENEVLRRAAAYLSQANLPGK